MRVLTVLAFGVLVGAAFGQSEGISLGPTKPIDLHVLEVEWQPAGHGLIYKRQEENGFSLGAYAPGSYEGKVVMPLQKEDNYEVNWLANSNSALVVVRGPATNGKPKSMWIRIYLVDCDTQKATQLFGQTYTEKLIPEIDVEVSPSLKHAIVTFHNSEGKFHKVLTLGGGNLADAPDLDRAEKAGLSGPTWSSDGTAIYASGGGDGMTTLVSKFMDLQVATDGKATAGNGDTFSVTLTAAKSGDGVVVSDVPILLSGLRFRIMPPMPKTGTDVLELMPANPILRPVRFRGPWNGGNNPTPMVVPQTQSILLTFDRSNQQDTSVWLKRGDEKGAPAALVAVHVTDTWLSEAKNGVAYTIDGALFFRSVGN